MAQTVPSNPLTQGTTLNTTQTNTSNVIFDACFFRNSSLQQDFRDRCNALVPAAIPSQKEQGVREVSPEQLTSAGITATRTTASQLRVIGSAIETRLQDLRASLNSPNRYAGFAFYQNGSAAQPASGGAAGADDAIVSPFGVWVNTNYQAGDVNSTFQDLGYNFKSGGVTLGADMRLMDNLIVGTAFSYLAGDSYFDLSGGRAQSNSYTGSIYGSYYVVDNVHLDALASYGGTDYDIKRNIQYTITAPTPDVVNTSTSGSPGGGQYSVSFGGGYDYSYESFNLNPFARFDYSSLEVDGYQETGGDGWAARFGRQNVRSLRTTLGAQTSYAVSTSFGVLLPYFRAAWTHEYKDNSRNIGASFVGDPLALSFNIATTDPTRNYATVGGGISGTFAKGITAFVAYDTLLGYHNVSSHKVVIGARLEF
ncbi:MAG: autotransporter outer membrane beta-barrel domain-containing protein [Methylococcales bacterium]